MDNTFTPTTMDTRRISEFPKQVNWLPSAPGRELLPSSEVAGVAVVAGNDLDSFSVVVVMLGVGVELILIFVVILDDSVVVDWVIFSDVIFVSLLVEFSNGDRLEVTSGL